MRLTDVSDVYFFPAVFIIATFFNYLHGTAFHSLRGVPTHHTHRNIRTSSTHKYTLFNLKNISFITANKESNFYSPYTSLKLALYIRIIVLHVQYYT